MKLLKRLSAITLVITLATSCSVQNGFIQKRKYSKGYHVSLRKNNKVQKQKIQPTETIETSVMATNPIEKTVLPTKNAEIQIKVTTPAVTNSIAYVENTNEITTIGNTSLKETATKRTSRPLFSKNSLKTNHFLRKNITSKEPNSNTGDTELILLVILAIILPPIAVGLYTDWETTPLIISIILTLLFWLPGQIYAFLTIFDVI